MGLKLPVSNPVILAVLDGWGIAPPSSGNAITQASTRNMNRLWAAYPHTQLRASGEAVGLPRGEVGRTETGHLNMGAGRIVYQDLARINMAIADGSFFDNQVLNGAFEHAVKHNSNVHLIGLLGAGGVHSNMEHLFALVHLSGLRLLQRLFIHAFTDGRDSPPSASLAYVQQLRGVLEKEKVGTIASIMGRYWAMDRDQRWERTQKAYQALTKGVGVAAKTPDEAIQMSYRQGRSDEFIEPTLMVNDQNVAIATIRENDAVIFFNFRIDRPRQLTKAFVLEDFTNANLAWDYDPYAVVYEKKHIPEHPGGVTFDRGSRLNNLYFVMMTEYGRPMVEAGAMVAFPPEKGKMPLGRGFSDNTLKQLRVAESEKERFVGFYFNGLVEAPFSGEDRLIVPSPKVPTYDQKPEMSALEMTDKLLTRLRETSSYRFVLVNFANVDMVGHTGNLSAAVKACETVDHCVGLLAQFVLAHDGALVITADHGNAEEMINLQTGEVETEHSANPVPFIVVSKHFLGKPHTLPGGIVADVAPTVLALMGLNKPTLMTGRNLLEQIGR